MAVNRFPTAIASVSGEIQVHREATRTTLAILVITLLGLLALFIVIWVLVRGGSADTVITGVFTPLVGIAGTVLGFYFGTQDKPDQ